MTLNFIIKCGKESEGKFYYWGFSKRDFGDCLENLNLVRKGSVQQFNRGIMFPLRIQKLPPADVDSACTLADLATSLNFEGESVENLYLWVYLEFPNLVQVYLNCFIDFTFRICTKDHLSLNRLFTCSAHDESVRLQNLAVKC